MKALTIVVLFFIGLTGLSKLHFVNNLNTEIVKKDNNAMLVISKSDWCASCLQLEDEVLMQSVYKNSDVDKIVILKVNISDRNKNRKFINNAPQVFNRLILKKDKIKETLPLVILLNKDGKVLAKASYKRIETKAYADCVYTLVN